MQIHPREYYSFFYYCFLGSQGPWDFCFTKSGPSLNQEPHPTTCFQPTRHQFYSLETEGNEMMIQGLSGSSLAWAPSYPPPPRILKDTLAYSLGNASALQPLGASEMPPGKEQALHQGWRDPKAPCLDKPFLFTKAAPAYPNAGANPQLFAAKHRAIPNCSPNWLRQAELVSHSALKAANMCHHPAMSPSTVHGMTRNPREKGGGARNGGSRL